MAIRLEKIVEIVKFFIEICKADIQAVDYFGQSIAFAAAEDSPRCLALLIENGANLLFCPEEYSILHYVCGESSSENVECIRLLMEVVPELLDFALDSDDDNIGGTPLYWALCWNKFKAAECLIKEFGADVNIKPHGKPIFFDWEYYGNPALFELLEDAGVDLRECDQNGNSIMHILAGKGTFEVFDFVAKKYPDLLTKPNLAGLKPEHVSGKNFANFLRQKMGMKN